MIILGDENDMRSVPLVNWLLILVTVAAFAYQLSGFGSFEAGIGQYGLVPGHFLNDTTTAQLLTLITSMFMHAGFGHLLGNLWFLFIFGDNVEEHFGHFNYLLFYITCGIMGGLAHILAHPTSLEPVIGASGAISGVMGAYLVLFPDAKLRTWWGDDAFFLATRTYQVPAWSMIGAWLLLQYACLSFDVDGIAWYAHIGGFAAGLLTVMLFRLCGEAGPYSREYKAVPEPGTDVTRSVLTVVFTCLALAGGSFFFWNQCQSSPAVASSALSSKSSSAAPAQGPSKAKPAPKASKAGKRHKHREHRAHRTTRRHK